MYSSTPRDKLGGVQAVYARLAAGLQKHGHSVIESWSSPSPNGAGVEEVYPFAHLIVRRGVLTPRSVGRVCRSLLRLARGLFRHRPEIVNIHFVRRESIYFLLLKQIFRYKVVMSAHGSDILLPTPWNAKLLPYLLPRADAVTAVTQRIADRILAYPGVDPQKVHVIPNGVDNEFWGAASSSPAYARSSPTIVTVGRLTRVKGHDVLIRTLARIKEHMPDVKLVIAGDGESRKELEKLARRLGVEQATKFIGYVSKERLRSLLQKATVFALPSRSEGMPLAMLEAMAAGVPTVATNVGGVPEVLTAGSGILVPPNNPVAMAEGVTRVLRDANLARRLSQGAKARARSFPISIPEREYAQLFASLKKGGSTRRRPRGIGSVNAA
jgi:glycosyltransferase involved in cell wall biosynthesis